MTDSRTIREERRSPGFFWRRGKKIRPAESRRADLFRINYRQKYRLAL